MPKESEGLRLSSAAAQDVPGSHPFRNAENHERLLQYLQDRLGYGNQLREQVVSRLQAIDKDVAGYMTLSHEDRKRRQQQLAGKGMRPTDMVIPLLRLHLDDAVTYFTSVFAPDSGIYKAVTRAEHQEIANAFAELMNQHAEQRSYFREYSKFFFDCLKYNLGAMEVFWNEVYGNRVVNDAQGEPRIVNEVVWEGNEIRALDMYNVIWDPAVHPVDAYRLGEYIARIERVTRYRAKKLAHEGQIFNTEELFSESGKSLDHSYYVEPPRLYDALTAEGSQTDSAPNWREILSAGQYRTIGDDIELVHVYIHLNPVQFGLVPRRSGTTNRDRLEVWRISLANGRYIVRTDHMNNAHGQLPITFGSPFEDNLGISQKSIAELLGPIQTFGSFLLNSHVAAQRGNLWGTTYYDPSRIDLDSIPEGEVAARVPVKPAGYGQDIRTMVFKEPLRLDTGETMNQLTALMQLVQNLFPTQSLPSQIAGIDRAIQNQVETVVMGATRRLLRAARMLDEQALAPQRHMMHWNILQFQPSISIVDSSGRTVEIDPSQFRDEPNIRFAIGAGLKSLDQSTVLSRMFQLVNTIIQNRDAAQQFNVPALLNFISDLMDINVDLNQFAVQPQQEPQI